MRNCWWWLALNAVRRVAYLTGRDESVRAEEARPDMKPGRDLAIVRRLIHGLSRSISNAQGECQVSRKEAMQCAWLQANAGTVRKTVLHCELLAPILEHNSHAEMYLIIEFVCLHI